MLTFRKKLPYILTLFFVLGTVVIARAAGLIEDHGFMFAGVTTLGLFGTGNFETDEAPQDWRETILYLFPNGDAPLNALLSKMGKEATESTTFNWWEKGLIASTTQVNGAIADVNETNIVVDDASIFRKEMQVFNPRTNEVMIVSADPANANTVVVVRGSAGSAKAAILNDDHLFVIGTVYAEGTGVGNPIYQGPSKQYNYPQIFKSPVEITESANKEKTRTGKKYEDMKEEALRRLSVDMELAFIFGRRHEDTGSNGKPRRFTGGIDTHFVTTNRFDGNGTLTKTNFDSYMEQLFAYGSEERLLLAGRTLISVIHKLVQANTSYQITTGETVYGIRLQRIVTPFGDLLLKRHPLFSTNAYLRGYGVALDLSNIKERPFREIDFKENVQDNDADEKKDNFICETGLEVNHEATHAIFENFTDFSQA